MATDNERPESEAGEGDNSSFPTRSGVGPIEEIGTEIGPYKLLSVLGEGGFGIVYLAEQKHPIRRQVALKLIKPGMDSRQVIARFEAERQALALMDHPNIAHVFDAGTTEWGKPYFVMEYIKGPPITDHCDRNKLDIGQRLKLFIDVCEAIQYAHQKGIIHRDIKPSNVLVALQGEKAVPKVIDFGVAKAMSQPLTERTIFTGQGQLIGTPAYMSPEQAELTNQDIDIRTDVYSLGVLLYELLAGVPPFDTETLRSVAFDEILRIIRVQDPPRPSTRLSSQGEAAKKIAKNRRIDVVALARHLHKELEWIPLKAIRKERQRRYGSASELAEDIVNYINGRPLLAGPDSLRYRLGKLLRKRSLLFASVSLSLIMVLLLPCILIENLLARVPLLKGRAAVESVVFRSHFRLSAEGDIRLPELNDEGRAKETGDPTIMWIPSPKNRSIRDLSRLNNTEKALLADLLEGDPVRQEAYTLDPNGCGHYVRLFRASDGCVSCHNTQVSTQMFSRDEVVGAALLSTDRDLGTLINRLLWTCRVSVPVVGMIATYMMLYTTLWISEGLTKSRRYARKSMPCA